MSNENHRLFIIQEYEAAFDEALFSQIWTFSQISQGGYQRLDKPASRFSINDTGAILSQRLLENSQKYSG